jgi:hypothetical protein
MGNAIGMVIVAIPAIIMWWLPTIIAHKRRVRHIGSIAVVNGFFGWNPIGWVIALAMAVRSKA